MVKTRSKKIKSNKTIKSYSSNKSSYSHENILFICLQLLNTVKLYHWKTMAYSEHKATDELYGELNDKIDTFVEILMGNNGKRINLVKKSLANDLNNSSNLKKYIEKTKEYFIGMNGDANLSSSKNSDLLNVRDEILGSLNKFTYLLTLK